MTATNTIIKKLKRDEVNRGWIFYDGECSFCIASAQKFTPLLHRHGFDFAPLQTPWVQTRLGLKSGEPLMEMKLLTADDKIFGGADAILQITRKIWWAWPLFAISFLPGIKNLLGWTYRQIAVRRNCLGGAYLIQKSPTHRHGAFFQIP